MGGSSKHGDKPTGISWQAAQWLASYDGPRYNKLLTNANQNNLRGETMLLSLQGI